MFFDTEAAPLLGVDYLRQTFKVDAIERDLARFPLQEYARRYEAVIGPGDIIFVPAGAPHQVPSKQPTQTMPPVTKLQVVNIDDTIAISQNYIDASNFEFAVDELKIAAMSDEGSLDRNAARALLEHFDSGSFNTSVDWGMKELSFAQFKAQHLLFQPKV